MSRATDIAEATGEFAADIADDGAPVPAIIVIVRAQDGANEADLAMVENFQNAEDLLSMLDDAREVVRASIEAPAAEGTQ